MLHGVSYILVISKLATWIPSDTKVVLISMQLMLGFLGHHTQQQYQHIKVHTDAHQQHTG